MMFRFIVAHPIKIVLCQLKFFYSNPSMKEGSGSDQKSNVLDALLIKFCNETQLSFGFNF